MDDQRLVKAVDRLASAVEQLAAAVAGRPEPEGEPCVRCGGQGMWAPNVPCDSCGGTGRQ